MKAVLRLLLVPAVATFLGNLFAAEHLDRGVVALPTTNGATYVGWRLLDSDGQNAAFDVYRSETAEGPRQRLNEQPITSSCNFVDRAAPARGSFYSVQPVFGAATGQGQ
jgi:rhamnogalacturonan endolyase